MAVWGQMYSLNIECLWAGFGLDLDSLGAGSRVVICPSRAMFVWLVIAVCVDCFCRHLLCHNWS